MGLRDLKYGHNNKALICALYVIIISQYGSNMHANKQLVNIE